MTMPTRDLSTLPVFRYHPDPVAAESIGADPDAVCPSCEQRTGWAYPSIPYGEHEVENICPWCIADGTAADRFDCEFVADIDGDVEDSVKDELTRRTPGFTSWQGDRWLVHCGDGAAFLGPVGWDRIGDLPDAQAAIVADGWDADSLPDLRADGDFTAYLFACLHCPAHLAYADRS